VLPIVRQFVRALTGMGRPIPAFMRDALATGAHPDGPQ